MSRLMADIDHAAYQANRHTRPNVAGRETQKLFTRTEHMVPARDMSGGSAQFPQNHASPFWQPFHPITGEPRWGECVTITGDEK